MPPNLRALREEHHRLNATGNDYIAPNLHTGQRTISAPEDASEPLTVALYEAETTDAAEVLRIGGHPWITRHTVTVPLDPALLETVRGQISALPHEWYEIFPADHNVHHGFHVPDPCGETTELLTQLASSIPNVATPPVNHNKISSRRTDKYDLNEIHVDSFEGMRTTEGRRTKVWRYFLNLSEDVRWTAIVPFSPAVLDSLLPVEYCDNYLDAAYKAAGWHLPLLLIPTPARRGSTVHGLKLCPTHFLHAEYGAAGDLLAVVNSLQ